MVTVQLSKGKQIVLPESLGQSLGLRDGDQVQVRRQDIDLRIRLVGTERDDLAAALDAMDRYALLPRDALHLSVMARLGIESIVTTDDDFVPVNGLTLFTGNPRILGLR